MLSIKARFLETQKSINHSALLLQSDDPMFPPDLTARAAALISRYPRRRAHGGDRGILHRRAHRGALDGDSRLVKRLRPRLCGLFQRGERGAARRSRRDALKAWRSQRGDGASDGRRRAGEIARGRRGSVTGIAGPDGGTAEKPVGLVHFACARRGAPTVAREERFGDIGREAVRLASVRVGVDLLEAAGGESVIARSERRGDPGVVGRPTFPWIASLHSR